MLGQFLIAASSLEAVLGLAIATVWGVTDRRDEFVDLFVGRRNLGSRVDMFNRSMQMFPDRTPPAIRALGGDLQRIKQIRNGLAHRVPRQAARFNGRTALDPEGGVYEDFDVTWVVDVPRGGRGADDSEEIDLQHLSESVELAERTWSALYKFSST